MLIRFRGARTVGNPYVATGVTQEKKRKLELLSKFFALLRRVKRYAQDFCIFILKFLDSIPESTPFEGSARGIRFGKEPKNNVFTV